MSEPWLTFAPLQPHWVLPKNLNLPFYFCEGISLRAIPEWVIDNTFVDKLRPALQDKLADGTRHCLAIEYEAAALGSPDTSSTRDPKLAIQETATIKIQFVNLALWLARPTSLSFKIVVHAVNHGTEWVTRQIQDFDIMCPLENCVPEALTESDLASAQNIFRNLSSTIDRSTIRTAAGATFRALLEQAWPLRFLLHWLAMESLFGPEDGREITFRLSQRVALFLESDKEKAQKLFSEVKNSYSWRSKVVHGLRLSKLKEDESYQLLVGLEQLVRRSFLEVLRDDATARIFDGESREKYLDSMPFK